MKLLFNLRGQALANKIKQGLIQIIVVYLSKKRIFHQYCALLPESRQGGHIHAVLILPNPLPAPVCMSFFQNRYSGECIADSA